MSAISILGMVNVSFFSGADAAVDTGECVFIEQLVEDHSRAGIQHLLNCGAIHLVFDPNSVVLGLLQVGYEI